MSYTEVEAFRFFGTRALYFMLYLGFISVVRAGNLSSSHVSGLGGSAGDLYAITRYDS